ncbi:MAG: hypothetical protein U0X76_12595 [Bacteroidia bacterium]
MRSSQQPFIRREAKLVLNWKMQFPPKSFTMPAKVEMRFSGSFPYTSQDSPDGE